MADNLGSLRNMFKQRNDFKPQGSFLPTTPPGTMGMLYGATDDPYSRPIVHNMGDVHPSVSTTLTFGQQDPKRGEVNAPSVYGGMEHSIPDAWEHYKQTGQHFGIFDNSANADAYENWMHDQQVQRGGQIPGPKTELFSESYPDDNSGSLRNFGKR